MRIPSAAALAAAMFCGLSLAANKTDWYTRSIYQVMVDRFARSDGSTTKCEDLSKFCDGTWAGLINKLDYIQDMGFTAVQISPVVKNLEAETVVGDAYHGYWSEDNYALNSHFGTREELTELADELHRRDMYLMVDVVVNNMASAFSNDVNNGETPQITYQQFNPFNNEKYYHPYCNVSDWASPASYQNCWLYPLGVALADLNTESPEVVSTMSKWIKELVSNYSIDGLRIDAAKHVNDQFLPAFVEASGVFAFGEVLSGNKNDFCRYQSANLLPGMPNYMEFYPLNSSFNGGKMSDIVDWRNQVSETCTDVFALGTFLENHDMKRFPSYNDDLVIAKNAMTYVLLNDGIPTVYQGQEQHYKGAVTPANREPIWNTGYDTSSDLYVLTAVLNKLRNNAIALSPDYITMPTKIVFVDDTHLCMRKGPDGSQIVYCVNNEGRTGPKYTLSVRGFMPGDQIIEVLGCENGTVDLEGNITVHMNRGEPKVYTLKSALAGTPLCHDTAEASSATSESNDSDDSGAAHMSSSGTGMLLILVFGASMFLLF